MIIHLLFSDIIYEFVKNAKFDKLGVFAYSKEVNSWVDPDKLRQTDSETIKNIINELAKNVWKDPDTKEFGDNNIPLNSDIPDYNKKEEVEMVDPWMYYDDEDTSKNALDDIASLLP